MFTNLTIFNGGPSITTGNFSPGGPFAMALSFQLLAMPDIGRVNRDFGRAQAFVAAEVLQGQLGLST